MIHQELDYHPFEYIPGDNHQDLEWLPEPPYISKLIVYDYEPVLEDAGEFKSSICAQGPTKVTRSLLDHQMHRNNADTNVDEVYGVMSEWDYSTPWDGDVLPIVVPSVVNLNRNGIIKLEHFGEEINAQWTKAMAMGGKHPKPTRYRS